MNRKGSTVEDSYIYETMTKKQLIAHCKAYAVQIHILAKLAQKAIFKRNVRRD